MLQDSKVILALVFLWILQNLYNSFLYKACELMFLKRFLLNGNQKQVLSFSKNTYSENFKSSWENAAECIFRAIEECQLTKLIFAISSFLWIFQNFQHDYVYTGVDNTSLI